jgi:hypothetical protein
MGCPTSEKTFAVNVTNSLARVSVSVANITISGEASPLEHELVVPRLERE